MYQTAAVPYRDGGGRYWEDQPGQEIGARTDQRGN